MKVFVTGGYGKIGRVTTEWLLSHDYDVTVYSNVIDNPIDGVNTIKGDILDEALLAQSVPGHDAIVHLAAYPAPFMETPQRIFAVNVAGTYNVFEAAAQAGIKRVVQASSINAIGCGWNIGDLRPAYFPLDEEIPKHTNDVYSFSKQLDEDIADFYWRRDGISSVSMRFPWVYTADYHKSDAYYETRAQMNAFLDELLQMDEQTRTDRIAAGIKKAIVYRAGRPLEKRPKDRAEPIFADENERLMHLACNADRYNFWAFLDVRDAAQSLEKALIADYEGSHPLFISDSVNRLLCDSETLLQLFFPDVPERKRPLHGTETIMSIDKARALIGYDPEYTVEETR